VKRKRGSWIKLRERSGGGEFEEEGTTPKWKGRSTCFAIASSFSADVTTDLYKFNVSFVQCLSAEVIRNQQILDFLADIVLK
jgi:hypothetical protein